MQTEKSQPMDKRIMPDMRFTEFQALAVDPRIGNDVTSEIHSSDVTFNVGCELSQPMGKTEFSSATRNRTNSVS